MVFPLPIFHIPFFALGKPNTAFTQQLLTSQAPASMPRGSKEAFPWSLPSRAFNSTSKVYNTASATSWALRTTLISPCSKGHNRKLNWSNPRSSSSASPRGCFGSNDTSFGARHCSRREMARSCCFLIRGHMLYWSPVERFVYPMVRKHAEV